MDRPDFKLALDDLVADFAHSPGISWEEAIEVFEAKIAEMQAEMLDGDDV